MSVRKDTETFVNKCSECNYKWRVIFDVETIHWYDDSKSIAMPSGFDCPKCRKWSPPNKITDKTK